MKEIYVYAGWIRPEPLIGVYAVDRSRSSASFSYDAGWIRDHRLNIDPMLMLTEGRQYRAFDQMSVFGFLSDASPDRWGRGLLLREEQYRAREEKRKARTLLPEDFLLGISDAGRLGGLRFKESPDGAFVSEHKDIPKITDIRRLEHAAAMYEDPKELMQEKWVRDLLDPGSSLGGARPKASVADIDGSLWIAKFPSRHDFTDVGAWEQVSYRLARLCGLTVPDSKTMELTEGRHTFLTRRFDRTGKDRIHFMSFMTALGESDQSASQSGKGFLDMAECLSEMSCAPEEDLHELFRRVAFTICISNTDCHFRNHAMLLTKEGWRLSPAYDLNPSVDKDRLAINVSDSDASIDLDLLLETADFYRLGAQEAASIIDSIRRTIAGHWEREAMVAGIRREEREYMRSAFRACEEG